MKLFGNRIRDIIDKLRGKRPPVIPVIIDGQPATVTEWARRQAALNMRFHPEVKERVIQQLEREGRTRELAEKTARERYPEAWR